jgi:hypothetical protein
MDPVTSSQTVQAFVEAVKVVGPWNVVLVILIVGVVINLPTIIKSITDLFGKKNEVAESERMQQNIGNIKQSLSDLHTASESVINCTIENKNKVESISKDVDIIGKDMVTLAEERRREAAGIIDEMEELNTGLEIIHRNMKNVMSEQDTVNVLEHYLGIKKSLKENIVDKIMVVIEELKDEKSGQLSYDIRKTIDTVWLEFLRDVAPLNTPIGLKEHFESLTENFWKQDGLFSQIVTLALNDYPIERIRSTISLNLDSELRLLHSKTAQYLQKIKESKERGA